MILLLLFSGGISIYREYFIVYSMIITVIGILSYN